MPNEQNTYPADLQSYLLSDDSGYHQSLYSPIMEFPNSERMFRSVNSSSQESNKFNLHLQSAAAFDISILNEFPTQDGVSPDMSSSEDVTSSPSGDSDSSDPTLKYIADMLLEEDIVDQQYMFDDHIALKATENSFYDVITQQYPTSVRSSLAYLDVSADLKMENDDTNFSPDNGFLGMIATSSPNGSFKNEYSHTDFLPSGNFPNGLNDASNKLPASNAGEMVQNLFSNNESVLLFNRGLEEARKFLPKSSQLVDLESYQQNLVSEEPFTMVQDQSLQGEPVESSGRNRKLHERDEWDPPGRNSKQSAVAVEEDDDSNLAELFDKVLLLPSHECCEKRTAEIAASDENTNGSKSGKNRKRQNKKKDSIDQRSQLILCAQSMSASDFRTASELLKQIRLHSSPHGDGSQRLAHYFANGLEARLAGSTGGMRTFYELLAEKKTPAADMLKAFQTLMCSCPFKRVSMYYLNKMIFIKSEHAKSLHIVDYGILFGYQWPSLIQILSSRPEGPPKLKITAIDLPQRGFRPFERIEETGRRLSKYCQRFKVPFEYHTIVRKDWESISAEELKISEDEFVVVNCLTRLHNFLDETGEGDCPRDVFLSSIRKMRPHMFCYCECNGSFNSPFFVTRFRETLFHYSAVFDYLDCTIPQDNTERLWIEEDVFGREAINVVACEGVERVTRPETYKQWQVRTMRAGFKQLPVDQKLMDHCNTKGKKYYHKDFVFDQDGHWLLQGWKGRILYCTSCWVCA